MILESNIPYFRSQLVYFLFSKHECEQEDRRESSKGTVNTSLSESTSLIYLSSKEM